MSHESLESALERMLAERRIGRISRLRPIIRADEHDQPLLSCIHHPSKGLLQYGIALLKRQKRQNIGLRGDPPV